MFVRSLRSDNDNKGPHCGRGTFDSYPPARDFSGYYMQAFKTVAQRASPAATMCAYNAIFGIPACASPINNDIVRDEWGWDGVSQSTHTHPRTHTHALRLPCPWTLLISPVSALLLL